MLRLNCQQSNLAVIQAKYELNAEKGYYVIYSIEIVVYCKVLRYEKDAEMSTSMYTVPNII